MNKVISSCLFLLILTTFSTCNKKTEIADDPIRQFLARIVKDRADAFVVEHIEQENGKDVFELESKDDKIILRGNNGVSVGSALNHYLKHYCHVDVSWNNTVIELPATLPVVETKVHKVSPYKYRYYINYCTFNYTMAWWNWERWQQEIDWMTLNGINMPLALTGEEAIWQEVYHTLGFTDEELSTFFTGPSFFSWFWMGNIDKWGGPLPQHWMDTHKELQKKILAQERGMGMTPILPAFTGHVPPAFNKKFPNAKLKKTNWEAGFDDVYILDAEDSLFEKIGALFLETQTKEYGTDHYYSADTFNENVPPTNDTTFLTHISNTVYKSMANTDPEAKWVMQGWMFHYNDEYWKNPQIKALLNGVPGDNMIVLDLYSESHPVWKQTDSYYGKPWIWNMLQNFGGNISLFGRMSNVAEDPSAALHDPASGKLMGIGLTPEGIEQNPALFELMLENVWQSEPVNIDEWLKAYTYKRYGSENQSIINAWGILKNTVYHGGLGEGGPESIIVARPTFSITGHRVLTKLDYDPLELVKVWDVFVTNAKSFEHSEGYRYDLVDITRQVLANYASPLQRRIAGAYQKKDVEAFKKLSAEFLELIDDMDTLLATHNSFLLGKWINDARSWGITPQEKNLYEFNARNLVTLWGGIDSDVHDYSNRQWSGLLKGFYKLRWEQFFNAVLQSMNAHKTPDFKAIDEKIKAWEWAWDNSTTEQYDVQEKRNSFAVAAALFEKYKTRVFSKQ